MIHHLKDEEEVESKPPTMTDDKTSLRSLHRQLFLVSEKGMGSKLPQLPREYFVHLWKNMHDLIEFGNLDDITEEGRNQMYHSISIVGTLLLQIGEVGQRVKDAQAADLRRSKTIDEASDTSEGVQASVPASYSSYELSAGAKDAKNPEWSVTFEQVLANITNEDCLVNYFDQKVDVVSKLRQVGDTKLMLRSQDALGLSRSVSYA